MNLGTNTVDFFVFIAHEIGFGAVAHRARRRTVSQLGVVSITSKPKSQPPHLVSTMGFRKAIASGLIVAAKQLERDQSKEQLISKTNDVRRKIARFIEPKTEADTKWIDDFFKPASK